MSEYAQRDHKALGELYQRHVSAMTSERLHYKSDIAAELAYRDGVIAELRAQLDAKWIACDERIPEDKQTVLTINDCGAILMYQWVNDDWLGYDLEYVRDHNARRAHTSIQLLPIKITHWQPLPAPPAQQSEERKEQP